MATSTIKMTNASRAGYLKMGDGTLIQWGKASIPANSDRTSITFEESFTTIPICLITIEEDGYTGQPILYDWQDLYATMWVLNRGATQSKAVKFNWLAIGRWK